VTSGVADISPLLEQTKMLMSELQLLRLFSNWHLSVIAVTIETVMAEDVTYHV
jgi:hypothetical protein